MIERDLRCSEHKKDMQDGFVADLQPKYTSTISSPKLKV